MNLRAFRLFVLMLTACSALGLAAAGTPPTSIATYECIGLYWSAPEALQAGECTVQFRREGGDSWVAGLPLVYDARDREFRGSIVGLAPNTPYEIALTVRGATTRLTARTRSDQFPIGETTHLPAGDSTQDFAIKKSGTPDAYHLVTVPPGGRVSLDAMNKAAANLVIDADYVIVRGLELRNAAQHGILIKAGRHDIVVENCCLPDLGSTTTTRFRLRARWSAIRSHARHSRRRCP